MEKEHFENVITNYLIKIECLKEIKKDLIDDKQIKEINKFIDLYYQWIEDIKQEIRIKRELECLNQEIYM